MRTTIIITLIVLVLAIFSMLSRADVHYVSLSGTNNSPYLNWPDAATNIQWAVDASTAGDTVMVSNGTYYLTNQVNISKAITLKGFNGRAVTILDGKATYGCLSLIGTSANATIDSLTIQRGYSAGAQAGGIFVSAAAVLVTNCVISNCVALLHGGGILMRDGAGGIITHSIIANNRNPSTGGGLGGGIAFVNYNGQIKNCIIAENRAYGVQTVDRGLGGAAFYNSKSWIANCLFYRNDSATHGGGMGFSTMGAGTASVDNCTFVGNTTSNLGGGLYISNFNVSVRNSIMWDNTAASCPDAYSTTAKLTNCCIKDTNGVVNWNTAGNITNDPLFVNAGADNYRFTTNSPCFNTGLNQDWMTGAVDLDGIQRITDGTVDMGCYEYPYWRPKYYLWAKP